MTLRYLASFRIFSTDSEIKLSQADGDPTATTCTYGTVKRSYSISDNSESTAGAGMLMTTSSTRRNGRRFGIMAIPAVAVIGAIYWQTSGSVMGRDAAGGTITQLAGSQTPTTPSMPQISGGEGTRGEDSSRTIGVQHLGREESPPSLSSMFGTLPMWATSADMGGIEENYGAARTYPELDYTVTNFYHERDGKPGAQIPWLKGVKLAEPYRDTTLRVMKPREGYTYTWEVRSIDDLEHVLIQATGAEATVSFTRLDLNMVSLFEALETSGQVVREKTDTVMVKYVRREIRTLTDEEREELLDGVSKNFASILKFFFGVMK